MNMSSAPTLLFLVRPMEEWAGPHTLQHADEEEGWPRGPWLRKEEEEAGGTAQSPVTGGRATPSSHLKRAQRADGHPLAAPWSRRTMHGRPAAIGGSARRAFWPRDSGCMRRPMYGQRRPPSVQRGVHGQREWTAIGSSGSARTYLAHGRGVHVRSGGQA